MRPPLLPAGCWGACLDDGRSGWPGPDRVRPHPRAYGCRLPGIAGLLRGPALVPLEPDRISGVIAHRPGGKEHGRVACRHRASIGSPHRRGSGRDLVLRLVPETTTAPSFVPERLLSGPNRPAVTQEEGGISWLRSFFDWGATSLELFSSGALVPWSLPSPPIELEAVP